MYTILFILTLLVFPLNGYALAPAHPAASDGALPKGYELGQNYPNPFNPTTTIRYAVPEPARVVITVFNLLGQDVATLVDAVEDAGSKAITWDATDRKGEAVSGGVYFYKMEITSLRDPVKTYSMMRKMILMR